MSSPSPTYERPAGPWDVTWRLLVCLLISAVAWLDIGAAQWAQARWWFWLDLGGGLISFVAVFFRRRWPVGVATLTTTVSLVSASAAGPGALAFVSLATYRRLAHIVPVGVLGLVTDQLYFYSSPQASDEAAPWLNFTVLTAVTVAAAAFGMYIGSRRDLLWSLREQAAANEARQALREEQARSNERENIAREMHDVLAHRISLITMHAGALAYRTDLPPEQVRETAQLISDTSHEALTDLREVLGTLRREEPMRPQPSLGDIPELVRDDELVELALAVPDGVSVPERIGRTAYRVVQEALTNARKHAPGQPVQVVIGGTPGHGLSILVQNPRSLRNSLQSEGSGFGLVGMRERVELAGGRLNIGGDDSFDLEVWLPWAA